MKTQKALKFARFFLSVIAVAAWGGIPISAQEKPTILLWQKGGIGQKDDSVGCLLPTQPQAAHKPKSEGTALALSFFGTLVPAAAGFGALGGDNPEGPLVLMGAGLVFGPSLGYFYAGRPGRGLSGIGIRLGLTAATLGATIMAGTSTEGWDGLDRAAVAFFVGSGVVAVAAITDVLLVPKAVRKHNRSLQEKALIITPVYFARHGAPGLKVQVQF